MKSLVIFEVKFWVLSHFWSLMLLSSEFMFFWSYFLEWMVESRFRTWFRAKNPIDEELRRKNPVWLNFSGSQNSKLSLCVFYSSFHVREAWHPPPSRSNNGNVGRRDIAICAICFFIIYSFIMRCSIMLFFVSAVLFFVLFYYLMFYYVLCYSTLLCCVQICWMLLC